MSTKSVAKNSVFNVVYRLINMLFPLVTSVYVAHILMASGVGKVSYAQNIAQYFIFLAPLGILNYGTREIAKIRLDKEGTNKLFSELFSLNFISTFCCSVFYYLMVFKSGWYDDEQLLYLVTGLPIIFNIINVDWYYQGQEDYGYIAIRSVCIKMIALVCMLDFVRTTDDYVVYALIYSFGIIGNYIFNAVNLVRKGVRFTIRNLNIKPHLKPVFILFSSNIAIELYILLDTTMLGYFCGDAVVGYYTNSMKLVKIVISLITAIGSVLLPRLSFYRNQGLLEECSLLVSKVFMVMFFFAVPCGIGIFLLADIIVPLMFGETFVPAIQTVKIATIIIYVLGFSNLFGTQVLLTFGQEKKLLLCTCVAAVLNMTMNLFLIPRFQHNGAVVASVVCESLVTIMTFIFAKKFVTVKLEHLFVLKTVLATICMAVIVCGVKNYISGNDIVVLSSSILLGATSYSAISLIIKNPLIQLLKRK